MRWCPPFLFFPVVLLFLLFPIRLGQTEMRSDPCPYTVTPRGSGRVEHCRGARVDRTTWCRYPTTCALCVLTGKRGHGRPLFHACRAISRIFFSPHQAYCIDNNSQLSTTRTCTTLNNDNRHCMHHQRLFFFFFPNGNSTVSEVRNM